MKEKGLFKLDRSMYPELAVATLLFITDIALTLAMPYFSTHKAYYTSEAYITILVVAYVLYTANLFVTKKKSASDIAVILFAFFALWEVSYKIGWIHNDLLVPSPEGLFHVFLEKQVCFLDVKF